MCREPPIDSQICHTVTRAEGGEVNNKYRQVSALENVISYFGEILSGLTTKCDLKLY